MGEAKQKSRRRRDILEGETRCIYCTGLPVTVEHMPPKAMFPNSHRLSGMEFAACMECNYSTRAADAAAAFLARVSPTNAVDVRELDEAQKLLGTMSQVAPEFVREVFDRRKLDRVWAKGRDAIFGSKVRIELDGPVTTALLRVFSAKLGMALYREHIGKPLPENGMVFTQHYLNAGLLRQEADAIVSILPVRGQLRQGMKASGRIFNYRYNTDDKTIVAGLVAFNDNLFIRTFATHSDDMIGALHDVHQHPPIGVGELVSLSEIWQPIR